MKSIEEVKERIEMQAKWLQHPRTWGAKAFYQGYITALRWTFEEELRGWDPQEERKK